MWSQRAPAATKPRATRDRILAEDRLRVEVAAAQADDPAAAQVDRRQELEGRSRSRLTRPPRPLYRATIVLARYYATTATTTAGDERWRRPTTTGAPSTPTRSFGAILRLETTDEAERFFRDLCTLGELRDLAQRWAVVRMLDEGLHYAEISKKTGASTATITRIASWLRHGEGGYQAMLAKIRPSVNEPA